MSLCDAAGAGLAVGDTVGTVTSGPNPVVLIGKVTAFHEVKVTVEITSATFTGEPVSPYARKLPKPGSTRQLNAYRVFRLGPCVHEQGLCTVALRPEDLRIDVTRPAAPNQPVRVRVVHIPTGCQHTEEGSSEYEARAQAIQVLAKIVAVHQGIK